MKHLLAVMLGASVVLREEAVELAVVAACEVLAKVALADSEKDADLVEKHQLKEETEFLGG